MNVLKQEPEKSFEQRLSVAIQFEKHLLLQGGNNNSTTTTTTTTTNESMYKDLLSLSKYIDFSESTSIDDDVDDKDDYGDPIQIKSVKKINETNTNESNKLIMKGMTKQQQQFHKMTKQSTGCQVSLPIQQYDDAKPSKRRSSHYTSGSSLIGTNTNTNTNTFSTESGRFYSNSSDLGSSHASGAAAAGAAGDTLPQTIFRQPKNVYQKNKSITYDDVDFKVPVYYHNKEEEKFLTSSLKINFMFRTLNDKELQSLVSAFEPCQFNQGQIIIQQGDIGDYFYVLQDGCVTFLVNNIQVGTTTVTGSSFGELALLYSCPRAATVIASATTNTLLRVNSNTFRHILRTQTELSTSTKKYLLRSIPFLQDLHDTQIRKLMRQMTPVIFYPGDVAAQKGTIGDKFFIIQEGEFVCTDVTVGNKTFEDLHLGPGDYFGERSLITSEPRVANVICTGKGVAFAIDKRTFERVLGTMSDVIMHAQEIRILAGLPLIHKVQLNCDQLEALRSKVINITYKQGDIIFKQGDVVEAQIFLVRTGQVSMQCNTDNNIDTEIISSGGYFGEQIALQALQTPNGCITASCNAVAVNDTVCGILNLNECLHIIESNSFHPDPELCTTSIVRTSQRRLVHVNETDEQEIQFNDLAKIDILGEGTFGQVWMVCDTTTKNSPPYALKIQSKSELVKEGQARAAVLEKEIMLKLRHPFIVKLINTYQDQHFIYMLLQMIQGGELFNLLHDCPMNALPEQEAKFYAIAIADAIVYMSLRRIVYRDLKPENIMIDNTGYPILVDFGFAKFVTDKTYTLCGTPGYISPECLQQRGYDVSADHWALGILIHEMLTGRSPFYSRADMNRMDVFKSIISDTYEPSPVVSSVATDLIVQLLEKDPAVRLGSLSHGAEEIIDHQWFNDIDIYLLRRRKLVSPWVPEFDDQYDLRCFEDWSTLKDKTAIQHKPISSNHQKIFENF